MACKTCELACAIAHSKAETLAEAMRADVRPQSRVRVEPLGRGSIAMQCRHCEDAPCIAICPTEAIQRLSEGGPVLLDPGRCIGCKYCMIVCPFGAIELSADGKAVTKCDLCIERTQAGELPACVAACPTHALVFTEIQDWPKRRRREVALQLVGSQVGSDEGDEP